MLDSETIAAMSQFGAQAKPAVPTLLQLLDNRDARIRIAATNALLRIDPDSAAKAGVRSDLGSFRINPRPQFLGPVIPEATFEQRPASSRSSDIIAILDSRRSIVRRYTQPFVVYATKGCTQRFSQNRQQLGEPAAG